METPLPDTAPVQMVALLVEIARVHHWCGLYATNHPFLVVRIHALRDSLAAQASKEPSGILLFGIVKDRVLYQDRFIGDGQPLISGFTETLYKLHVATLGIGSDVSVDGLSEFFRRLREQRSASTDDLREGLVVRDGIPGIHLSPVNYKEVLARLPASRAKGASAETPESRAAAAPFGERPVARKGVTVLLELLLSEKRAPDFLDLLSAVANSIPRLIDERDFESLERVLSALSVSSEAGPAERRTAAAGALAGVDFERIIEACLSDPVSLRNGKGGVELLVKFGAASADALLDRLLVEERTARRKALLSLVVRLGGAAVAPIIARISHPRWFYVRNLCLLLGDIGDPAAVPALVRMLSHREMKVRREAVQALGKLRTYDPDAVVALGRELLAESLFSSREDPLRIDAASALFRIGGAEAMAFLHRGQGSRKAPVRRHCAALLALREPE